MPEIVLVLHNIRSTYNVGSILRTAEGLGVEQVIFSGYTPYPQQTNDCRLPHISRKIHQQIHKTALGAEMLVDCQIRDQIDLSELKSRGFRVVGLEQRPKSIHLNKYRPPEKIALLLGEEVNGIDHQLLSQCDDIVEIPMRGQKESFNVSVAAAISLYHLLNH